MSRMPGRPAQVLLLLTISIASALLLSAEATAQGVACLVCCDRCGIYGWCTCYHEKHDDNEDSDCKAAKSALKQAVASGRVGAFRGGKQLGAKDSLANVDGMSCSEAISLAQEHAGFEPGGSREAQPVTPDGGAIVRNDFSRIRRDPAESWSGSDPFREIAGRIERKTPEPIRSRKAERNGEATGGESTAGDGGVDAKDARQAAIANANAAELGEIVDGQAGADTETDAAWRESIEANLKKLRDLPNPPDPNDPTWQAKEVAVIKALLSDPAANNLPPGARQGWEVLDGPAEARTAGNLVAAMIESQTGRDPRPLMSPTFADAGGTVIDAGKAFGGAAVAAAIVGGTAPATAAAATTAATATLGIQALFWAIPTLKTSGSGETVMTGGIVGLLGNDPNDRSMESLALDQIVNKGYHDRKYGLPGDAPGLKSIKPLVKLSDRLGSVADVIGIADRAFVPVSEERHKEARQLWNQTRQGLSGEVDVRAQERSILSSVLDDPLRSPREQDAIRSRINQLWREESMIKSVLSLGDTHLEHALSQNLFVPFGYDDSMLLDRPMRPSIR